jgi:hypothetical protein
MSQSPNRYFNHQVFTPTQKLAEDLVIEAIRAYGFIVYYMPKELVKLDEIFGEDGLMKFENAIPIEMYPKNTKAFGGQGIILQKLGVEVNEEVSLIVSTRRFEEIRAEHLLDESGQVFEQEITYRYAAGQFNGILLEDGNKEGYFVNSVKPLPGDLIYIPVFNKIYDIKYTDMNPEFYQFGRNYVYELSCQVFQYSNEKLNTGYPSIDSIEDLFSLDSLQSSMLAEDGSTLTTEDDAVLILDEFKIETKDKTANNSTFTAESENIIDFSEVSPFVKGNVKLKW